MSSLKNGNGTLIALAAVTITILGGIYFIFNALGDVSENKALAANNESRIGDVEKKGGVDGEKIKQIEKRQDEYNSAIKQILVSSAAQKVMVENVQSSLRDITRLLRRRPPNE